MQSARYEDPLVTPAARASRKRSWPRRRGGGFRKSAVKTLGPSYLLKQSSFCIYKPFRSFQQRLLTAPANNSYCREGGMLFPGTKTLCSPPLKRITCVLPGVEEEP